MSPSRSLPPPPSHSGSTLSHVVAPALGAPHPALTPMAFVQAVVLAYQQRGLSPAAALAAAQIAPSAVQHSQARITALQMELLCGHAMRELDDEALGWFSRRLPWGSYGMLARASIGSPNLGLAMARWCRHHHLLTDDIQLLLHSDAHLTRIELHSLRNLGAMQEFCLLSVLRNLHGFASWLVDTPLPLRQATFPFAAPDHAAVYEVLFQAPVVFAAPLASIELDAHWLTQPLVRDEAALTQMLQRALPIQVRPYRPSHNLVQRVRQAIAAHPQCGHTADSLATLLHLSPRSLHRQLQQAGTSMQQLKDEVRCQRACALLLRSDIPLKRIALACGFASEKSFGRAFVQWLGSPPQTYRLQHKR